MQQNLIDRAPQLHGVPVPHHAVRPSAPMQNIPPNTRPSSQVLMPQQPQQHAGHCNMQPSYHCNQPPYPLARRNSAAQYDSFLDNNQVQQGYIHRSSPIAEMQRQVSVEQSYQAVRSTGMPPNLQSHAVPAVLAPLRDSRQSAPRSDVFAAPIQPSHAAPNQASVRQNLPLGASHQTVQSAGQPSISSHASDLHRGFHVANGASSTQRTGQSHIQINVTAQQEISSTQVAPGTRGTREPGQAPFEHNSQKFATSESAFAAADRHAFRLLTRSIPALNSVLEVQKNILRDEFLHLNAKHQQTLTELKAERIRASQAEQEASEARLKQESILRASETILSNALKWKESLEDTRRKYSLLQAENTRIGRIALELNNRLKEDSSGALISALRDRVRYLEAQLKKYEEVHAEVLDTEVPQPVKGDPGPDTSSSTLFPSPERILDVVSEEGPNSEKQRLQRIVVDLLERNVELKSAVDAQPEKEMSTMINAEAKPGNASYVIDLTTDDSEQEGQDTSLHQDASSELTHHPAPDPARNATSMTGSAPSSSPLTIPSEGQKRDLESGEVADRSRKRVRPNSCSPSRADPGSEATRAMENLLQTQDTETDGDEWATVFACSDELVGGFSSGLDSGKGDAPGVGAQRMNQPVDSQYTPPQLDSVHLQLIYHKNQSGASECRFCVMENELNCRKTEEKRIFLADTTNEELVHHALSDHLSIVSHMLKLERSEILEAFVKIMAS